MARPAVSIGLGTGALGRRAASLDGVALLVMTASADYLAAATSLTLVCNQLKDVEAAGLTSAADTENDARIWEHVKDFYVDGSGPELHILLLPEATTLTNLFSVGNAAQVALANYLRDQGGRIRLVGVATNPTAADTTVASGISADLLAAIPLAQALADAEFELRRPVQLVLEGRAFAYSATITDLRTKGASSVSVCIGQDKLRRNALADGGHTNLGYAQVGRVLSRLARIPVMRNLGRVRDGKLKGIEQGALSAGAAFGTLTSTELDAMHDKGYIFYLKHPRRDGYYFNYDSTCTALSDDYYRISQRRPIDKAAMAAHDAYLDELLDEVEIGADGKLPIIEVARFTNVLENAVATAMQGEVSNVEVIVNDDQDVLTTDTIEARLDITPMGQTKALSIGVNYKNPNQ